MGGKSTESDGDMKTKNTQIPFPTAHFSILSILSHVYASRFC